MNSITIRLLLMSIIFTPLFFFDADGKRTASNQPETKRTTAEPKIVYVNISKIITFDPKLLPTASIEWRDLYSKLQSTIEPIDTELKALESKFESGKTEFESLQKSGVASNEALQRKYEELARAEIELRKRLQEREQFVNSELTRIQGHLSPKIEKAIKDMRRTGGYSMVLRGEAVVDADDMHDITADVLALINKQHTEEEKAKKAAQAQTQTQQAQAAKQEPKK